MCMRVCACARVHVCLLAWRRAHHLLPSWLGTWETLWVAALAWLCCPGPRQVLRAEPPPSLPT